MITLFGYFTGDAEGFFLPGSWKSPMVLFYNFIFCSICMNFESNLNPFLLAIKHNKKLLITFYCGFGTCLQKNQFYLLSTLLSFCAVPYHDVIQSLVLLYWIIAVNVSMECRQDKVQNIPKTCHQPLKHFESTFQAPKTEHMYRSFKSISVFVRFAWSQTWN